MLDTGDLVEVQATGENGLFDEKQLGTMLDYARSGLKTIFEMQKTILLK